jgi:uncharacterized coiled-coil protein SlyX
MFDIPCLELHWLGTQLRAAYRHFESSYSFQAKELIDELQSAITEHRDCCKRCAVHGEKTIQVQEKAGLRLV